MEGKIQVRKDSVQYLVVRYIERALFLYDKLFRQNIDMTEQNARKYIEEHREYMHIIDTLRELQIYNWLNLEGEVLYERDVEIK